MIDSRENSRHQGRPVRLFLFKGVEPSLEVLTRSVTIIPGSTEFGYGTTDVTNSVTGQSLNRISAQPLTDFISSVEELLVCAPNLKHVSLVVTWHGTDLRLGNCQIMPKVENSTVNTSPFAWQVGPVTRSTAQVVSYIDGKPALGGAPSDRTVYEAITFLKSKGLQVTLYPFIVMDIPPGNTLPNPYTSTIGDQYIGDQYPNNSNGSSNFVYDMDISAVPDGSPVTYTADVDIQRNVGALHSDTMYMVFFNASNVRISTHLSTSSENLDSHTISYTVNKPAGAKTVRVVQRLTAAFKSGSSYRYMILKNPTISASGYFKRIPVHVPLKVDNTTTYNLAHVNTVSINYTTVRFYGSGLSTVNYDNLTALEDSVYGIGQPAFPWRGRITCYPARGQEGTADQTYDAGVQVSAFFGTVNASHFGWDATNKRVTYTGPSNEWSFRRHILHLATIAKEAGADDFLIGSEMVGMTQLRSDPDYAFPAVTALISLLGQVRTKLGSSVKISYAADWSEYHSYKPNDGSTDILFPMDPLWANADINYVGIDNYFPMGDWRDGNHLDRDAGYISPYEKDYIQKNIEGGEYYDWYYASDLDRTNQIRTPINDAAYGENWIYRQKDVRGWWLNQHHMRLNGVRQVTSTGWTASSKQIVFTELGLPAVEKGINQPNVFVDPKSSESSYPYFSNQRPDAAIQRAALEAVLDYWKKDVTAMVNFDKISLWTWDARPYPTFPERADFFGDAGNWQLGHWLTGRLRPGFGFDAGEFGPYAFCDGEEAITRAGITYQPFPISISDITSNGNLDKSDITVTMARGSTFENEFIGFPVSHVVNLIVFQGHTNDAPTLFDYPAIWVGRVGAPAFENETIAFNCVPVSTSIQRPGLRRNYQLSCPHVLFGPQCRASRKNATVTRTVTAIAGSGVTFDTALPLDDAKYRGGLLEWTVDGHAAIRTIVSVTVPKTGISIRGNLRGLTVGSTIKITFGCNRLQSDCADLHQNILNFGGQPSIPLENPLSQKSIFY